MTDPADQALVDELRSTTEAVAGRIASLDAERDQAVAERDAANRQAASLDTQLQAARAAARPVRLPGLPTLRGLDLTRAPYVDAYAKLRAWKPDSGARYRADTARVAALDLTKPYVTAAAAGSGPMPATDNGFMEDMTTLAVIGIDYDRAPTSQLLERALGIQAAWVNHPGIAADAARNDKLWLAWATSMATTGIQYLGPTAFAPLVATLVRLAGGDTLPLLDHPQSANWLAVEADARLGLRICQGDPAGIAREAAAVFDTARWVIYLRADGTPTPRPGMKLCATDGSGHFWVKSIAELADGQPAEFTRDLGHTVLGTGSLARAVARARGQGIIEPAHVRERITRAAELFIAPRAAAFLDGTAAPTAADGNAWEAGHEIELWLYGGALLPRTAALALRKRPSPRRNTLAFETLLYAAI